ncbi:MAG: hypothetical protein ACRC9X_06515 [Bacteroidales bacterium]
MKKLILISLMALPFLMLNSCAKESEGSIVSISVKKDGVVQPNVTVYMFNSAANTIPGSLPSAAKKEAITDENGVAKFDLQDTFEASILETLTMYFTVLGNRNAESIYPVLGTTGPVSVEKSISKAFDLTIQ